MSLPQGQLFEHVMSGRDIRDVQDERDADTILQRVPLVDFAIEIELHRLAHFHRQDGAKTEHKALLWGMYVRPHARKSGAARRLVDAVVAHATGQVEQLQLAVVSENAAAIPLYTAAGFVEYGREVKALKHADRYYDEILMALFLNDSGQ